MKIFFHYTHRAVRRVLISALIATALAFSALRFWLLPDIDAFRQTLETQAGALMGETVRIEGLSARLRGIHPEIQLRGLTILDRGGKPALRFGNVRLNLDTLRSLAAAEPRFDGVEIVRPGLTVRHNRDGSLAVVGLGAGESPPAWVLADGRIDLREAEVVWQDAASGAPPLRLGRMDLQLRNAGGHHALSAAFSLPRSLGRSLRLAAEADGDPLTGGGWRGRVYLEGQDVKLGALVGVLRPARFGLLGGRADLRVWLDWPGRPGRAVGDLTLQAPVLVHRPKAGVEHRLALRTLSTRFLYAPAANGWQLDLNGLRPGLFEPPPETRLAVRVRQTPDGGFKDLSARLERLDLSDGAAFIQGLGLAGEGAGPALQAIAPRGTLEHLRVFHAPERPPGQRLAVCARFRGLAVNAFEKAPGFSGLEGQACGTDAAGRATLKARGGNLDMTGIGMRPPVPLDQLEAELRWRQEEGFWIVEAPDLSARNPEIAGRFKFTLALPKNGSAPFLDLTARLTDVKVATLHHYAPRAFMPETSQWIERSLLAGNIPQWDILLRGYATEYPYYQHQGVFQSTMDIDDLTFRYSRDWPLVTGARARFEFDGPTLKVDVRKGRVGSGRIQWLHADVEDTFRGTWVRLDGSVRAGISESLDFLAQSPLKRIPEKVRRLMSVSGNTTIGMHFDIPLDDRLGKLALKGTAELEDAGLRTADLDLSLDHLHGPLLFDPDSLRADGVAGRFLDGPVRVDLGRKGEEIELNLTGRAEADRLREHFPSPYWRYARGAADYRLNLGIPDTLDARSAPIRLKFQSDLAGLALDLPAPLGKPAEASRPLTLETRYRASEPIPLSLTYAPDLAAHLRLVEETGGYRPASGDLALSLPLATAAGGQGFTVALRLNELDAGAWQAWWSGLEDTGGSVGAGLREFRLDTPNLAWKGRSLGPLALDLRREAGQWRGSFDSGRARGEAVLSAESIRLDLDRLTLPDFAVGEAAKSAAAVPFEPPQDAAAEPDPAAIPPLRIRSRKVLWNHVDLGPLELDTERHARGMVLRRLTVKGRDHLLAIRGDWTRTPNRAPSTRLEGSLHVGALGELLALAGKTGQVRDTATDIAFKLDWPGGPQRYSPAALSGDVEFKLGKGSLLGIEPGLGRIIGVLNFNALWRRLSLDFSDLFGKGLAYDRIVGTFRVQGGQAVTDAFLFDAVSAKIFMSGRIGLAARDMHQFFTVIPHTSAALPLAGALAGGPAVGAAMLVARALFGDEMDRMTASQYEVRGGWDNPVTTRIYRQLPLDVLDQAWDRVKKLSGFGSKQEEQQK